MRNQRGGGDEGSAASADYDVPEILFMRSFVIVSVSGFLVRYGKDPSIFRSPHRSSVVLRAALMFFSWLLFYNAARHLELAQVTTLYFSAPITVVFLSIWILKEKVDAGRWVACIVGFVGVAVAANPTHRPDLLPTAMCLLAGFFWAWSTILVRIVSRSESTLTQVYAQSFVWTGVRCLVSLDLEDA